MRRIYTLTFGFWILSLSAASQVRINEIYGGGGGSGTIFKNDFIELYNNSNALVSLTGWSVQYAASNGTGVWAVTNLTGSIPANGFYLIQEAAGAGGTTNLPTPDATGAIAMSATNGKVALVNSTTALNGACPAGLIDLVGYGSANCFEGAAAAPVLTNTTSAQRTPIGTDTQNNSADFTAVSPSPSNSGGSDVTPPSVVTFSPANAATGVATSFTASAAFSESVVKAATGTITIKKLSDNSQVQTIDISNSSVFISGATLNFPVNGLALNTAYYVEISSGAFKDMALNNFAGITGSGTWGFTTGATAPAGTLGTTYNFNTCASSIPGGFTTYSVTGAEVWGCTTFGRDPANLAGTSAFASAVQINGFTGGTNVLNEDWLISPSFDLSATAYPLLSFWSRIAFNGAPLQLKVSTDYPGTGDPKAYTWTDINGRFPLLQTTTNAWTLSQNINLSAYKSNRTFFAFVYHSTPDDGARWTLDDILVSNSATPPPASLSTSTTDILFGAVTVSTPAVKTFIFIGNDLTGSVTLTSTGSFLLSKTNGGFTPSITYTQAEANNIEQIVYVLLLPTQHNSNYTGTIAITTTSITNILVNLTGNTIDPALTLEVVNWNLEWFGTPNASFGPANKNQQEANIKTITQNIGADLFAFVEVVSEPRLQNVVAHLNNVYGAGTYSYVICDYGSNTNPFASPPGSLTEAQKEAFVYKTAVIAPIGTPGPLVTNGVNTAADLTNPAFDYFSSGRYPYMMHANVTLGGITKPIRFVLIHAKANTSPTATTYIRRKKGADTLNYTLNNLYPNDNIVLLGDFNDDLDQSIAAGQTVSSYSTFNEDAANFFPPTLALSLAGKKSTVSYNDMIDHVELSNEMKSFYMQNSANVLSDVTSLVDKFSTTTSDHFPIITRFAFINFPTPYQLTYSSPQNAIKPNGKQLSIADPIQLGTGTYSYKHNDIKIPSINGALDFTRFYNSLNGSVPGPLGYGWSHTYNYYLQNKQDTAWDVHYPDGHISTFIPMNNGGQTFPVFSGTLDSLQKNNNKSYSLFTKEKQQYHFDSTGKLDSIIDLNNNTTNLHYTANNLDSIVALGGRSLIITYSGNKISSVKDPLNRVCNYSYDANNNLITVTDVNNGIASFTYDGVHSMLTAVNPLGNIIVNNTYDITGKVVSQKDAYSQVTSIVYNSPNPGDATVTNPDNSQIVAHHDSYIRKTSEKDELGFTKTFAYDTNSNENKFTNENNQSETRLFDNFGNLLADTLPGNKITQAVYNNFNAPTQLTDAKGNQKKFYYNNLNNNLDSIRYPDNSLQIFSYNSYGQLIQSIDGNGNAITYTYSGAGDLLSTKTFAGIKQFAYDAAGRKVSATDENGHTTSYVYDNNDNLIKNTDALGHTIQNIYDANNQLLSVKDKKGFTTTYTYDKKGRKTSSTNPKGGVTAYAYDVRDNLLSVTDPNNKIVSYTYDKKGRKTSVANALGNTQYQYDGAGNLIKVIDPTNKTTDYTYTTTNKKQSEKDGLGNTSTFNYDSNDNLVSATDPLKRITGYGYDVMNRLTSVTDAAKKTTSITYDKNGNKKTVVDPNGHTQNYAYDAANRMINYQDASGNNYTSSYDSAGNNKMLTKPTGTITKVFDAANRATTINNSTGNNYLFVYDNNDNVVTMSNNTGASNMIYDSLNLLIQYQDPYNKTVAFTYDAGGNKTSVIYPGNKSVSYAYDNANNLKTVTDWLNHTFTYTYDAAGRPIQLLYPNAARCNYGFDNAGRLTSKLNSFSNNTIIAGSTFTLDAVGNRIAEQKQGHLPPAFSSSSFVYNYDSDDKMLSDSIWNFVNDNSGNRISETNGIKTANYTFSIDNLLNNWADTLGTNTNYSYDPLGHRISKVAGANTDKYVLDISSSLSQILQITDAGGAVKSNYVYGLGLLETIDATNIPLYYHFDAQHNTAALTDQNGVINDLYTYDPFGTILSHNGTSTQPFTFWGEYGVEQESSSILYARARYYDAANGRFISKDVYPSDFNNPQTINRYVYATNNPISIFDYTGLYGEQDSDDEDYSKWARFSDIVQQLATLTKNTLKLIPHLKGDNSFLANNSSSFLGKFGGSLVSGLSTIKTGIAILQGDDRTSKYFDLTYKSTATAVGLTAVGAAAGIITAPAWIPAAALGFTIGGIIYSAGNIYSEIKYHKSISENLFDK